MHLEIAPRKEQERENSDQRRAREREGGGMEGEVDRERKFAWCLELVIMHGAWDI
jgi:hypothetical protein